MTLVSDFWDPEPTLAWQPGAHISRTSEAPASRGLHRSILSVSPLQLKAESAGVGSLALSPTIDPIFWEEETTEYKTGSAFHPRPCCCRAAGEAEMEHSVGGSINRETPGWPLDSL